MPGQDEKRDGKQTRRRAEEGAGGGGGVKVSFTKV